jgi:sulfur-oxidizing protein SoxY
MGMTRRQFFSTIAGAAASAALVAALPERLLAAWSDKAFTASTLANAIAGKYGNLPIEDSTAIQVKAPEIAENGAVVPVTVATNIAGATNISIFTEANFAPMVASFDLLPRSLPEVSLRMRMAKTATVVVLVQAGNKLYRATREVKVTIGGCGG